MCSISGMADFLSDGNINLETIRDMRGELDHRGPDQNGLAYGKSYAFAHNRLAVIDVENGRQPMRYTYGNANYCIVYNGELYNANELRKDLLSYGHKFSTHCDTEVLLIAYAQWGESCVDKLNGIFAFAVYDSKDNKIFCARDRLGVKPFFYTVKNSTFIFASEIKGILKHPDIKPQINQEGIWQLIYLSPTRLPNSGVFKNIDELAPGCCLTFSDKGLKTKKYWQLTAHEHEENFDKTVQHTRELVFDAIERQLVSDVPLCSFLSGGLDSSIISSIASSVYKKNGQKLSTYSFEFEGNHEFFRSTSFQPESDEEYALYTANQIGSKHTILSATSNDCANLLYDSVKFRDLPGMADIDSSLLFYCKQVKKHHTVGMSGECADEIFGGYPWFYKPEMLSSGTFPWIHSLNIRSEIFNDEFAHHKGGLDFVGDTYAKYRDACPTLPNESNEEYLKRLSCFLSVSFFMTSLLERKDRMSMASGLEVRVPFADHRIIEYIFNVPWAFKYKDNIEKYLLRKAAHDILPQRILYRKKSPYPKTHNPNYENIVSSLLKERMQTNDCILKEIINKDSLGNILEGENITWFGQLMGRPQLIAYLLQLDFWFKHYKVEIC